MPTSEPRRIRPWNQRWRPVGRPDETRLPWKLSSNGNPCVEHLGYRLVIFSPHKITLDAGAEFPERGHSERCRRWMYVKLLTQGAAPQWGRTCFPSVEAAQDDVVRVVKAREYRVVPEERSRDRTPPAPPHVSLKSGRRLYLK